MHTLRSKYSYLKHLFLSLIFLYSVAYSQNAKDFINSINKIAADEGKAYARIISDPFTGLSVITILRKKLQTVSWVKMLCRFFLILL